ncbi:MAG: DUF6066 family protein [Myxococcaceae bacterium]|nr:DUF6066 family protein [Myxococcaceae bacterium]MCI0670100.1 DUF6066 family protein [Myxococcaceae bacterium]
MRRLVLALLLLPTLAVADDASRFEQLRAGSEPLGGLGPFLEKFVGDCEDAGTRAECAASAGSFRERMAGKRLFMLVTEDAADMMAPGAYDASSGELTVLVTPIFGARGMALTHGVPRRMDADGNPVLQRLNVEGGTSEGWTPSRFQRLFSQRELRLEVVFTPEDTWQLRGRAGRVKGVRAKVLGMRVVHARSGDTVATWFAR